MLHEAINVVDALCEHMSLKSHGNHAVQILIWQTVIVYILISYKVIPAIIEHHCGCLAPVLFEVLLNR